MIHGKTTCGNLVDGLPNGYHHYQRKKVRIGSEKGAARRTVVRRLERQEGWLLTRDTHLLNSAGCHCRRDTDRTQPGR